MTDKTFARGTSRSPFLAAAALTGALALSMTVLSSAARAEDGEGSMMSSVLQVIGVEPSTNTAAPKINYRERPPLVLPKTMNLPPPERSAVASNPAWPHDPDVMAARRAAMLARAPAVQPGQDTKMTNEQLMKVRDIPDGPSGAAGCGEFTGEHCDPHKIWDALKIKKGDPGTGSDPKEVYAVGKEPPRIYLTQPPPGYLAPTKIVRATLSKKDDREDRDDNPNTYYDNQAKNRESGD